MSNDESEADVDLLVSALDHAWRRFEFRLSNALRILNYYLIAVAVLAGAYVGALNSKFFIVAAAVSFGGSIVSLAAFYGGWAQIQHGRRAIASLHELEDRVGKLVKIVSFRSGFSDAQRVAIPRVKRGSTVAASMFVAAVLLGILGGGFALAQIK